MIFLAVDLPMPGSATSCDCEQELMSILPRFMPGLSFDFILLGFIMEPLSAFLSFLSVLAIMTGALFTGAAFTTAGAAKPTASAIATVDRIFFIMGSFS